MYRAAIIGCGKIASGFADDPRMQGDIFTHAEAYTRCPDTSLTAICDTDTTRLEACGKRWHVENLYTDIATLLEQARPEIISICTPDHTHARVLRQVLRADGSIRAVLCEKPLALTTAEARDILQLADEKNIPLAVIYMRRFAENILNLKAFLQQGQLGTIQGIAGWYTKGVRHNGTHWFDMLRMLIGEVRWVHTWNRLNDNEDDPTLDVLLGMESGVIASLRAADSAHYTVFEMDILGSRGRVQILDSGYIIQHFQAEESKRYSGYRELYPAPTAFGHRRDLMLHAVENVIAFLQDGTPLACSGEDGLAALAIAEAAIRSSRSQTTITLT